MAFGIDKKRWENFWYYHKPHVYIGVFVLGLVIMTVRDCMQRVDPDVSLYYMGADLQMLQIEKMEQLLIDAIEDVNNDGKKHVLIGSATDLRKLQIVVMTRDTQLIVLEREHFDAYAVNGVLYPLDEVVEKYHLEFGDHPEVRITPLEEQEEHVYGIPLEENPLFAEVGLTTKGKYLAMIPPGVKPNPKEEKLYKNAHMILEKIITYGQ